MSDAAHNGHDDVAYYEADIGRTWELSANDTGVQVPEADGPLPPGRYLIQAFDLSAGASCWIHTGKAGVNISMSASAGKQRIPLTGQTILAIETHVRKGVSDRLGAVCSAGATATVWATLVSTPTPG